MNRRSFASLSNSARWIAGVSVLALAATALSVAPYPAQASPSPKLAKAQSAFAQGRYAEVERLAAPLASGKEAFEARALMARLKLRTGQYAEAELWAKRALAKASDDAQQRQGLTLRGEIEARTGRYEAALKSWTRATEEFKPPKPVRAHLMRGVLLMDLGRKAEAQPLLDRFADGYNDGTLASARELAMVGEAVWKMAYYEDANAVLGDATKADPSDVDAFVVWGDLFVEKYNTADAAFAYDAALKVNPNHPGALLGKAWVWVQTDPISGKARGLLARALKVNPAHPEAHMLDARLKMDDEDYDAALEALERALKVNPNHLEALALVAACHYLKDDKAAFEATRRAVFKINPRYANLYTTVGRFGVRVHRYDEAIKLNLEALKLVPDYAPALVELGIGYTRIGDDAKGLQYLRKAYDSDPFNVRTFNMVELYEETLSKQYMFVPAKRLRFRFHKLEAPVLRRVVPPLMERASASLSKRYRFKPADPTQIEVFRSPETFSVRSVGLPHISPHGICFGRVVTARSPSSGDFNWAEVLWHELAHVYHIQLSNSRVPRWFTEGLAEFEAGVARPEWRRELDRDIVAALKDGTLLKLVDLNRGFTRAPTVRSIVTAYFQSTLVIEFMVERWGFDSVLGALKRYGKSQTTPQVIRAMTGLDMDGFDRAFEAWLRDRYAILLNAFEPSLDRYTKLAPFEAEARAKPTSAHAHAEHAAALYVARRVDDAEVAWKRALKLDPNEPLAHYLAALYALRTRNAAAAQPHLKAILDGGNDGYALRLQLGSLARRDGRPDDAIAHYLQAARIYPQGDAAWRQLAELYAKQGKDAEAARALNHVTLIEQDDYRAALKLAALWTRLERHDEARVAAERAANINPFQAKPHALMGRAALALGDAKRARAALELAADLPGLGGAQEQGAAFAALAQARLLLGDRRGAREALTRAESAWPDNPELSALRAKLGR